MNIPVQIPEPSDRSRHDSPRSKFLLASLGCLLLTAALGRQLHAQSSGANPAYASTIVRVGDLDLSTPGGMKLARDRIHQAAKRLCEKVVDPWSLSHEPDYVQCVDDTMATALKDLPGPSLASAQSGSRTP
jgi:UrcA family protein